MKKILFFTGRDSMLNTYPPKEEGKTLWEKPCSNLETRIFALSELKGDDRCNGNLERQRQHLRQLCSYLESVCSVDDSDELYFYLHDADFAEKDSILRFTEETEEPYEWIVNTDYLTRLLYGLDSKYQMIIKGIALYSWEPYGAVHDFHTEEDCGPEILAFLRD